MNEIELAINAEHEWFNKLLEQMKGIHSDNKSVVTVLEFIEDCIEQRGK